MTTTTTPALAQNTIYSIAEDNRGRVWIGTDNQGLTLLIDDTTATQVSHNPLLPHSLSANAIGAMLKDQFGNLWVGTVRSGLNLHRPITESFEHLLQDPSQSQSNDVRALAVDRQQRLWAGLSGQGVVIFERIDSRWALTNKITDLHGVHPFSITQDSQGDIWIGTEQAINRINPATLTVKQHYSPENSALQQLYVTSIVDDQQGSMWFAHWYRGLSRFDKASGEFTFYSVDNSRLASRSLSSLWLDRQNTLWIAGSAGLAKYLPDSNDFANYPLPDNGRHDHLINNLMGDSQNGLWLTERTGVWQFNGQSGRFHRPATPTFLQNEFIYDVLQGNDGTYWASGNRGLLAFDPGKSRYRRYWVSDGLQSNEFNAGASAKFADGRLAFGGVNGITIFQPGQIASQQTQLVIADITVHSALSEPTLYHEIADHHPLTLEHDYGWLSLSLANLSFADPKQNHFAYRLKGLNDNWVDLGNSHKIIIPGIQPGQYQLEVIARGADGHSIVAQTHLPLEITPPWHQTGLAYTGYALLLFALGLALHRFKLMRLKQQARELKKAVAEQTKTIVAKNEQINRHADALVAVAQEKTTLMANLSHELRTPITLILGPVKQLHDNPQSTDLGQKLAIIERNTLRLNRLVNQMLDLSQSAPLKPDEPSHCNISELASELTSNFSAYVEHAQLTLQAHIEPDICLPYGKDELEKILSNLLTNAIKYNTPKGWIELSIAKTQQQQAVLTVKDSGIGIAEQHQKEIFNRFFRVEGERQSAESSGIGLNIIKHILEAHQDDIQVSSTPGQGSTFTVTFNLAPSGDEASSNQASVDQPQPETDDDNKPSLLIIDDNEDMLSYLASLFAEQYQVQTLSDSLKALETARTLIPDLILSDVMMPNLDGMALLELFKADELTNHIPVILLTAKGSEQSRLEGLSLKADAYLAKPFNPQELQLCIRNQLDSRDLLKKKLAAQLLAPVAKHQPPQPSAFLKKLDETIEKHYADPDFNVAALAKQMAVGERQLLRKLRAVADTGVAEYIRVYRLKKAAERLRQGMTPSNVALETGFSSLPYFSNCFKSCYGQSPSQFQQHCNSNL